jgi:predicted RNA binding protein YcfA (HicA-like mRNA interferase family)
MTDRLLKLYKKLKGSQNNASFTDLCKLAEEVGFVFRNQSGSHSIYKHPIKRKIMNFQPDKRNKSKAKKYQINQLINFIDENEIIKEG